MTGKPRQILWLLLWCCWAVPEGLAQEWAAVSQASTMVAGVQAFEAELYHQAKAQLSSVVQDDTAFFHPELGSAAYWLGQTYQAVGQEQEAAAAWEAGWIHQRQAGRIDLRLNDALIWDVFVRRDSARYGMAAEAYLALLHHLEGRAPEEVRARYLVPLMLILPEDVRQRTGLQDAAAARSGVRAGSGAELASWWRRMDGLPATRAHEQLTEHLERIAHAVQHFGDAETETGLDDRGVVYVRLGPPSHQTEIYVSPMELTGKVTVTDRGVQRYVNPSVSPLPENEFWVYWHVDDAAQYLFIREPGTGYRLGLPDQLIPRELRTGLMRGSPEKEPLVRTVLDRMFSKFALYHPPYGPRLEEIDRTALSPTFGGLSLWQQLQVWRGEDQRMAWTRDREVPAYYTNVFDGVEALPVALRRARFLDPDGTTRTELYWTLQVGELRPSRRLRRWLRKQDHEPSDEYLLQLTVLQQTADYRDRAMEGERILVTNPSGIREAVLPVRTFAVRGDTGRYHLALEWDAYWVEREEGGALRPGPKVKVGSFRLDSLQALRSDPERLEVSDLKPLHSDAGVPLESAAPYAAPAILPERPLALYFEVYHLSLDAEGRSRYTVSYEIGRAEERSGVFGFLRRGSDHRITAQTQYEGSSRTARETILLDLSDFSGASGTLEVTVRVEDETTGQEVERTLSFEMLE